MTVLPLAQRKSRAVAAYRTYEDAERGRAQLQSGATGDDRYAVVGFDMRVDHQVALTQSQARAAMFGAAVGVPPAAVAATIVGGLASGPLVVGLLTGLLVGSASAWLLSRRQRGPPTVAALEPTHWEVVLTR